VPVGKRLTGSRWAAGARLRVGTEGWQCAAGRGGRLRRRPAGQLRQARQRGARLRRRDISMSTQAAVSCWKNYSCARLAGTASGHLRRAETLTRPYHPATQADGDQGLGNHSHSHQLLRHCGCLMRPRAYWNCVTSPFNSLGSVHCSAPGTPAPVHGLQSLTRCCLSNTRPLT